jgi:hypothetical protein
MMPVADPKPSRRDRRPEVLLALLLALGASAARADGPVGATGEPPDPATLYADNSLPNPAAAARAGTPGGTPEAPAHGHLSTYEMAPVIVSATPYSPYKDDELIGDYIQPRWTAQRLFPGTRVYVIPRGEIDVEQWFRFETPKGGGPTTLTAQSELEFGLPHRLQLDLYLNQQRDTGVAGSGSTGNSIELRYAFADWDRLWGNPAVYLEWTSQTGMPDKVEGKLLLGGDLAPGWHWGANLSVEQQTSGARSTEKQVTAGISRTVVDHVLELGAETRRGWTDERSTRGHYARDLQVGPSVRWRPLTQMHVDFAPLLGITGDSMSRNVYLIFGWEF